ncbi:MAG: tRNA pseudouridine(55) synthase TruB [Collinsella sp.]|nr:tRNA pseudouridine(55) synthase TruB [Collinsella sp.]
MARRRGPADLNALIAIDKPQGMTSHDVVSRVRRAVGERRAGHAGTLDPLATGVLVVGIGQATRLLGHLTLDTKGYVARIRFGMETTTDDAEGEPARVAAGPASLADPAFAAALLARFLGAGEQVPPAFSAISVDGVRSYARARAGEEVSLAARHIEVMAAQLLGIEDEGKSPAWTVAFTVSKGTYIRALARDIGRAAGGAAHIEALSRTASGSVGARDCLPLEGLDAERAREGALDPVRALGIPALAVGEDAAADVTCGRSLSAPAGAGPGRVALVRSGGLIAIARPEGTRLAPEIVFPQPIEGVRL